MARITRRALLLTTFLATRARLRASAQRTAPAAPAGLISAEDFLRLSQRLVARPTLDPDIAAIYLEALLAVPANVALLADLARNEAAATTPAHDALERTIVEWWYTGVYTVAGQPRLATHTGALMWNALGMAAPGTCAGPFGAWSRPPRAA
jgi:hypothetical protein